MIDSYWSDAVPLGSAVGVILEVLGVIGIVFVVLAVGLMGLLSLIKETPRREE